VRQTALAPAEVVSLDAQMIASPLDGVIRSIAVRPNQAVHKGQLLFSLDDTTLRSRMNVAERAVETANAELVAASQKTFDDARSRDEVASLAGKLEERRAELNGIRVQLDRVDVRAARDGVAVFADPNDWIGKPVATGERIMELADPQRPAIRIDLPVADAITLDVGAPVRLYLTVHPLSAYSGTLIETSYQSLITPDQIVAYRLRAAFDGDNDGARIGLRGTVKMYGPRVALGYFLFRRPLSSLRARVGL
jgi:multidrug resistance efflux pump